MSQSLADQLATTALSGGNAGFIEDLYERFLNDPNGIDPTWAAYFRGLQGGAVGEIAHTPIRERLLARLQLPPAPSSGQSTESGGASAKPFVTHHNALDMDLYCRIAPELHLKRLLVGGLERVYEIGRNFRNEGLSAQHNPEFTMLEFYAAYADFSDMMEWTEEMLAGLLERVLPILGAPAITYGGVALDFTRPWRRLSVREALAQLGGIPPSRLEDAAAVGAELAARRLPAPPGGGYGHLLMALFEHLVEPQLVQPTFIVDYPVAVSPLSKQRQDDPRFTERFELYVGGMEIANGFSELNDPDVQAERFRQQLAARERGDEEAHLFDHDYVRALEHGMPPAGGEGLGIDRLTMLLADRASIRDVVLFPLLRPEAASPAAPTTLPVPPPAPAGTPGDA